MKDIKKIIESEYKFTETKDETKLNWYMDYELIKRDFEILKKAYTGKNTIVTLNDRIDMLSAELERLSGKMTEFNGFELLINFMVDVNRKRNEVAHSSVMYELDENGYKKIELLKRVLFGAKAEIPIRTTNDGTRLVSKQIRINLEDNSEESI